jgi:hypothetical protein
LNIGREIVAEALQSGDVKPYLAAGLTASWVNTDLAAVAVFDGIDKRAWLWLLDHHRKHGVVPSLETFQRNFPAATYRLPETDYRPSELTEMAQDEVTAIIVGELSDDLVDLHDDGRWDAILPTLQRTIQRVQGGIKDTTETAVSIADFDLEEKLRKKLKPGVPFGIKEIDEAFYGFQPTMLITLLGRQKSTKSTLMLNSALAAWRAGYSVLFYSVELDIEFLRERLYAIGAGVSPHRFRLGKLRPDEKTRAREFDAEIRPQSSRFRVSHKKAMVTMDDLEAEVDKYRPDVVYIDGFYFMQDRITRKSAGSDWQANENLAAELKTFAMDRKLVVVTSTQAQEKQQGSKKKRGIEARTIMGGTGLNKASDLMLGASSDDDGVFLNEVLSRFTHVPELVIRWDWDTMKMDVTEHIDHEAERDKQRDEFVATMDSE